MAAMFRIVVAGEPKVGKTWLCSAASNPELELLPVDGGSGLAREHTIAFAEHEGDGRALVFRVLECGDPDQVAAVTQRAPIDGVMLVFDVTRRKSFTAATTSWFSAFPRRPTCLVGTKADAPGQQVFAADVTWQRRRGGSFCNVSARWALDAVRPFTLLARSILGLDDLVLCPLPVRLHEPLRVVVELYDIDADADELHDSLQRMLALA